jgi:transcriptional regulator with XRE-family HTH domain
LSYGDLNTKRKFAQAAFNIRQNRMKRGLKENELAKLCKMEKASISRIESGKTNDPMFTLLNISGVLPCQLMTNKDLPDALSRPVIQLFKPLFSRNTTRRPLHQWNRLFVADLSTASDLRSMQLRTLLSNQPPK